MPAGFPSIPALPAFAVIGERLIDGVQIGGGWDTSGVNAVTRIDISGLNGADSITVERNAAHPTGTTGVNIQTHIFGGDGNDTVNGGDNNDTVYGENDDDVLNGFESDDTMYGGYGNDTMDGGANNDKEYGDLGDDSLAGGTDNDTIYGWYGYDNIDGGAGADSLMGERDGDTIDGGNEADFMSGGDGDDSMFSLDNSGSDTVDGGLGTDSIGPNHDLGDVLISMESWPVMTGPKGGGGSRLLPRALKQ